ncbi:MAG: hypothetical protein Q8J97_00515, partial [Flavobacteriaceae bacterium]|nr:hypothetical protein [Flavobacteriaceae bacterium]
WSFVFMSHFLIVAIFYYRYKETAEVGEMSNVILKLIGDEWDFKEKIVISVPAQKPFNTNNITFAKKLGLDTFGPPWTLYHTEGKPPGVVRPTRPIAHSSNPTKEKLAVGTILYVKEADSEMQRRDVEFQESLEAFRRSAGKKANDIEPDGSDVDAFVDSYSKNLNVRDATHITEMEITGRDKLEGEAYRIWWSLTFELREVADFKAAELSARTRIFDETAQTLQRAFDELIKKPLLAAKVKTLETQEASARSKSLRDVEDEEWADLTRRHRQGVQRLEEDDRAKRQADASRLQLELAQAQAAAAAAAATAAGTATRGGGGGSGVSADDMEQLTKQLKDAVQSSRSELLGELQTALRGV